MHVWMFIHPIISVGVTIEINSVAIWWFGIIQLMNILRLKLILLVFYNETVNMTNYIIRKY